MISVIIPTYNEKTTIQTILGNLALCNDIEIIVVDGGSSDNTLTLLNEYPVKPISARKGRAHQMNAGAQHARGQILLFLHADCLPQENAFIEVRRHVERGFVGGCLRQKLDAQGRLYFPKSKLISPYSSF